MGIENEKEENTMRNFKFLQPSKKERVFTDFMDAMDDYHLGGIPLPTNRTVVQDRGLMRPYTLNVFTDVLGRIPTFLFAIEQSNLNDYEQLRGTTLGQLTNGELNIPWCFTQVSITRISDNSLVTITYDNVDEMDRRALIFDPQDRVTICYKP
jgi:hypothetical protein